EMASMGASRFVASGPPCVPGGALRGRRASRQGPGGVAGTVVRDGPRRSGAGSGRQLSRDRGLRRRTVDDVTDGGGPQRLPYPGVDDLLQEGVAELERVLVLLGDADAVGVIDEGLTDHDHLGIGL